MLKMVAVLADRSWSKDPVEESSQVTRDGGTPSVRNKPCRFRPLIVWSCVLLQHNLAYPGLVENIVLVGKKGAKGG